MGHMTGDLPALARQGRQVNFVRKSARLSCPHRGEGRDEEDAEGNLRQKHELSRPLRIVMPPRSEPPVLPPPGGARVLGEFVA